MTAVLYGAPPPDGSFRCLGVGEAAETFVRLVKALDAAQSRADLERARADALEALTRGELWSSDVPKLETSYVARRDVLDEREAIAAWLDSEVDRENEEGKRLRGLGHYDAASGCGTSARAYRAAATRVRSGVRR